MQFRLIVPDTDAVVQVGEMVGEGRPERIVRQLPVEAGHVAVDPAEVLEAALGGAAGAVTGVLRHLDAPGTADTSRL